MNIEQREAAGDAFEPRTEAWAEGFEIVEDGDDRPSNRSGRRSIGELVELRLSRRGALASIMATAGAGMAGLFSAKPAHAAGSGRSTLGFEEIENVITQGHRVSPGHIAEPLIAWGDPLWDGDGAFDGRTPDGESGTRRFGYNNDFTAFMPLPRGSKNSDHGLLCVNHEYTSAWLMWPGGPNSTQLDADQVLADMSAHGHSVVEIKKDGNSWSVVRGSGYTRRILPTTPIRISGPAAGHERMKTAGDPSGRRCKGTFNNCAGGTTPWGTVLIAEENFNKYFAGDASGTSEANNHERYGIEDAEFDWRSADERFDVSMHPREANRFGWVVEYDPYDPESEPVKRTALGRIKHEGSTTIIDKSGKLVVYMGDDQQFEYVYKFVTDQSVSDDPEENRNILDDGTLYVARFEANGGMEWLPLVHGEGPLTEENGFGSQAEVLIETRRAADLLGATPMDRPEDVEPNPVTGKVFVMLTNNSKRSLDEIDPANPREKNLAGHIIEIVPPGAGSPATADHVSTKSRWEVFLLAGDPSDPESGAVYHPGVSRDGWLLCPDNCCFDNKGRLWIATDQGSKQAKSGIPDGIRATDTEGSGRALTKLFFACPVGAEMCGPTFTPDNRTMFVAVQHPGETRGSTYDTPITRWPADEESGMPPRPAIVAITRGDGGVIGE